MGYIHEAYSLRQLWSIFIRKDESVFRCGLLRCKKYLTDSVNMNSNVFVM
ncbi:hypothetical protein SynROS8604_00838 [Synechococcus sp. ROS8604]|nr:hypothetical protein SynROS8604_00838 [Synechococcus sp. ROS8604]